ncbi:MAG: hypothetical protein A3F74_24235 [Betaproteobacteria bacterium RIFCSPLOWO2_12_FULL_62_58]|nr:MAG: hypothetical protein A3F74_24235 [Betaproteobacteria bacterium RIFCSPLOWO2_12_FULL_62_58]
MIAGHPNPFVRQRPELPWPPPTEHDDRSRVIPEKIWELADIKAIAQAQVDQEAETLLSAITDDCIEDLQKLEFTARDVAERILQLQAHHYDKSMWCMRSKRPGVKVPDEQLWFPCDAYVLRVKERVPTTGWEGFLDYYVKLCLTPSKKVIVLISFHPPKLF